LTFQREETIRRVPSFSVTNSIPLLGRSADTGPISCGRAVSSEASRVVTVPPCGVSMVRLRAPSRAAEQLTPTVPTPGTANAVASWPAAASLPRQAIEPDRASGVRSLVSDCVRKVASTWQRSAPGWLKSHCQVSRSDVGAARSVGAGAPKGPRSEMIPSNWPVDSFSAGPNLFSPSRKSLPVYCVWSASRIAFSVFCDQSL